MEKLLFELARLAFGDECTPFELRETGDGFPISDEQARIFSALAAEAGLVGEHFATTAGDCESWFYLPDAPLCAMYVGTLHQPGGQLVAWVSLI